MSDFWTNAIDGVPYLWTSRFEANIVRDELNDSGDYNSQKVRVEKVENNAYVVVKGSGDNTLFVSQSGMERWMKC